MIYWQLFWNFLEIGALSFGGGLSVMPLLKSRIVDANGWLSLAELTDLVTISEMTPGPIAINAATFVGLQVGGLGGALLATLGCILPSCTMALLLSWLYARYKELGVIRGVLAGLRPTVVALILSAGLSILTLSLWGAEGVRGGAGIDLVAAALFAAGLFLLQKFKLSPFYIMLGSGVIGGVCYLLL